MARFRRKTSARTRSKLDQAQALITSVHEGLASHEMTLVRHGTQYLTQVSQFAWKPGEDDITCQVEDEDDTYTVTMEQTPDCREVVGAHCSCPTSAHRELCKHTYAALRRFEERLNHSRDDLLQRLFGVEDEQVWTDALAELNEFLSAREQSSDADEEEHSCRLTWRIGFERGQKSMVIDIEPFEQRAAEGGWSKGRKVSWERLAEEAELWTSPADEKIAEMIQEDIEEEGELDKHYEPDPLTLLEYLVGHPLAFRADDPTQSVQVREERLGLLVEDDESALLLYPAIDGRPPKDRRDLMVFENESHQRIVFFDPEENLVTLGAAPTGGVDLVLRMTQLEPVIPKKGQKELLAQLLKLETVLPVELPEHLQGDRIAADTRTFLRVVPGESGGVAADLRVRPAPGGMHFEPGQGPAEVSALTEGGRATVRRHLQDEITRVRGMAERLGLARHPEMRPWRWVIDDNDEALDLVTAAEAIDRDELIVEWPEGGRMTVTREVTSESLRVHISSQRDWFGLNGTIEIDGEEIPLSVLLAGIRDGAKYINIGEDKFVRIALAFRSRLAALGDVLHESRSGLRFDMTAAPVLDELLTSESFVDSGKRWQEMIDRFRRACELSPDPPVPLTAELRDYQLDGYRWLRRLAEWGVGGCLADDMGLGKTVQTLALLLDRMEEGPALVVAPTSVVFNWLREIERFAPTLRPLLYRDMQRDRLKFLVQPGDVVVVSYGLVLREAESMGAIEWGTLVLDEAQKIKNAQTKTARAVHGLPAKWRLALTGTPLENHIGELWSIFRAVCPGLFGSWDDFRDKFVEPIEKKKDARRRKALSHLIRPFILRRTKSEVLDELPDRTEVTLNAELSDRERSRYEETRLQAVAQLAGLDGDGARDPRFAVLASLTRLRQIACHPQLVDKQWKGSSAKLDLLLEIVEELKEGGHRALVFSQFTQHLALIRAALDERGVKYQYLDGSTPAAKRTEEIDAFQRGEGDLFLISLKAGGTGLNLTAADYVIHMDPWWNPAVEDQATDRAHRIGQTRPVTVYRLVTKDTIEEQILALHADKRTLVSNVLEGADQADKLTTEELIELIKQGGLKETAVTAAAES